MGNMILASILLAVVIIFTAVNSVIICNICDEMIKLIDENNTDSAIELWKEKKEYIQIFIRDAEIDIVSAEADALGESISIEDGEIEMGRLRFREAVVELKNSEKRIQEILRLKFVEGKSSSEIGAELGIAPSTVRKNILGILQKLREALQKELAFD